MKKLLTFNRLLPILTIPVAVFLITVAYQAPRPNLPAAVGPHVWPIILLCLLSVCSVFLFLQAIRDERESSPLTEDARARERDLEWYRKPAITGAYTIVGVLLYAILLESVGFIICTFLIVLYQTRVIQKGKWFRNIATSLLFSLACYFAMTKLLLMRLPPGLLDW
jgi:putative tricarboxylic transport membrane protein